MADRFGFQAQIVSIIEMLANSAVVEICKLVDDAYAAQGSKLDQEREESRKENDVLRQKLLEMDVKMQSYERRLRGGPLHPLTAKDPSEETPTGVTLNTSITSSYPQPSLCHSEVMMEITCRPGAKCNAMNGPCKCSKVCSSDDQGPGSACRDFIGSLRDASIKTEIQTDEPTDDKLHHSHLSVPLELDEPSPEHLNNLDLDLPLMHKHVSHLGAAYADAQCGLENTNSRNSSSSFLLQEEGDSLDCPPTVLFIGGTRKMAAFPASLDMAAANATVKATPPPPPLSRSTASSAKTLSQAWPPKNSVAFVKEPKVCAVCRCVFSCVAALKLHHQVHTRDRPYTCPHCGKGFAQPNNLRVHLLVHTGERRYRCTLCGKSFISSSHLKRHHTVHTQEKPYSCSRCGQSFSQMCSVRRHRQQSQCGL